MYRTPIQRYTKAGMREAKARAIFCEAFLTHAGNDEYTGTPIVIDKWKSTNIWKPLFATGNMDKQTGRFRRRYRRALIGVHRTYGKSELAASIVLSEATMNPVPNGEYGVVADSKTNTKKVRDYIAIMIRNSRDLSRVWKVNRDSIINVATGQQIWVYPYKEAALQGKHFNVLVCDELHVWRDDAIWKAGVSGQGKIWNALTIGITTAGSSRDGFLFKLYQQLKTDPNAFICWLGINDSQDVDDRKAWRQIVEAGRVTMPELEEQRRALGRKDFERYWLNRTPMDEQAEPFMHREDVEACQRKALSIDRSRWFTFALDGAVRGDTLALVAAQRQGDDWALEEWCWEKPDPMGTYDLMEVADVIRELSSSAGNPFGGCDPARMQFLANWLDRECGIDISNIPQTPAIMCPASELLARSVETHTAAMADTPVLAQHCINAVSAESKAYGRRLASEKGRHGQGSKRIDAAVAAAMAMWAYDNNESDAPSVWTIDL
jgi:phage terminase large subunit-like protein